MTQKKTLYIFSFFFLFLFSPVGAESPSHEERIAQIKKIFAKIEEKIAPLEKKVKKAKDFPPSSALKLLKLYLKVGEYDRAREVFHDFKTTYLSRASDRERALYFEIYLKYLKKTYQYEKFLKVYPRACKESPEQAPHFRLMKLNLESNGEEISRLLMLPANQFSVSQYHRLTYGGIFKAKKARARKMLKRLMKSAETEDQKELAKLKNCYFHRYFDIDYGKILEATDALLEDSTYPVALLRLYSIAYYYLGKFSELIDILEMGAKADKYEMRFYYNLGNGQARYNYQTVYRKYPQCFPETTRERRVLDRAKKFLAQRKYKVVQAILEELKEKNNKLVEIYMLEAEILRNQGRCKEAIKLYRHVLDLCPHYGRAYDGIATTYWKYERSFRHDVEKVKSAFETLKKPAMEGAEKYFINLKALSPKMQKLLVLSVAHWKHFVPLLNKAGATFYIKPIYERLTDYPPLSHQKGQRRSYNRLADDIRGQGGYHAVMSIADLEQTLYGGYNTVLHEMTHQVHRLLTEREKSKLSTLFEEAMKEDRIISRYQSSNGWEYFAVGMDSYYDLHPTVETVKIDNPQVNVATKDPKLVKFIEKLLNLKDLSPYIPYAYLWKGDQLLNHHKNPSKARMWLEKAAEKAPQSAEIREALIELYQVIASVEGKAAYLEKAFEEAKKGREDNPHSYDAIKTYAEVFYTRSLSFEKVLAFLVKDVDFKKVDLKKKTHVLLGDYYLRVGNLPQGAKHYQKALEINPRAYFTMADLARIYTLSQDVQKAEKWYEKAISLSPGYGSIREDYIEFLLERGKFKKATGHLKASRLKANTLGKQDYLTGLVAYYQKKDYEKARRAFSRVLKTNPKDYRARLYIVESLVQEKKWSQARRGLKYFEKKENWRPVMIYVKDWRSWVLVGWMEIDEKRWLLDLRQRVLRWRLEKTKEEFQGLIKPLRKSEKKGKVEKG